MNVDDIARRASQELRDVVGAEPGVALAEFRRLTVRRQRLHATVAAATVAAALLLGAGALQWAGRDPERVAPPASQMTPPPEQTRGGFGCEHERISCLGGDRYAVHFDVDMLWTLPAGLGAPYSGPAPTSATIESHTHDGQAGVTVFHHVSAAANDARGLPLSGQDEARELIGWLSARPFLDASTIDEVRLGDRRAWTVEVTVPPSSPAGPALCQSRFPCSPVLSWAEDGHDRMAGIWPGMTARYTALDLHGSGITVIWTWCLDGQIPPAVEQAADSIRFE